MNPKSRSSTLTPKKSLGQNFLRDPNTVRKIVRALEAPSDAHVVEIGPGMGALTGELIERYPLLTAIEVDERAVEHLREGFPDLDVRHSDVLELDWPSLAAEKGGPLYVIGNLPYYITSQILFALVDHRDLVREAVVMMQLEVAERLVAEPRTKAYGILSVQLQLFCRPELLFRVPRTVFYPRPDVTSAVVRLRFEGNPGSADAAGADTADAAGADAADAAGAEAAAAADLTGVDISFLKDVVRTAFNQRRKTLRNSLSRWTRDGGISLPHGWENRRAEELTPGEFVELTRYLQG